MMLYFVLIFALVSIKIMLYLVLYNYGASDKPPVYQMTQK